jgi:hypothetical protein
MIPFALPIGCLGELRLEAAGLLCAACGRTCPLWMKSRCRLPVGKRAHKASREYKIGLEQRDKKEVLV